MWRSVHQWAVSRGDSPALRDTAGSEFTYTQLWNTMVSLATKLRGLRLLEGKAGVRPVAVLIAECCPLALVELAIMLAGSGLALCPLDSTDPRLSLMLLDLEPVLVVCLTDTGSIPHACNSVLG